MYFSLSFLYICPVTNKQMITAFLFLLAAKILSKTTPPPHCETWEEIQSKIDNQPK